MASPASNLALDRDEFNGRKTGTTNSTTTITSADSIIRPVSNGDAQIRDAAPTDTETVNSIQSEKESGNGEDPSHQKYLASGNTLGEDYVDPEKDGVAVAITPNGRQTLAAATAEAVVATPKPGAAEDESQYMVRWAESDPDNPFNWTPSYKSWVTLQLSLLALAPSLGSSITAPASNVLARDLNVSEEAVVLNVSLYVLGFAIGPLLWAPISEVFGRRVSLIPAMVALGLFSIGTATSETPAAVFVTRFFGGVFGSAPVSNVTAALGDIWTREVRGIAVSLYAVCVVGGPTLGPTIGSAILINRHLGWRWTEYILAIYVFAVTLLAFFCLPEVYGPVLLKRKAQRVRKETGDQRFFHPQERVKVDIHSIITKQLSRPLQMLTTEPIVMTIAFYASFTFAILYLTLEAFPIVFQDLRGYSPLVASLPFLGLFIGVIGALVINLGNQPIYIRKSRAANGRPVPEARLPPMAIGAVLLVVGLFLFGWTAQPRYSWVLPSLGAVFIGAGFNSIFQQCLNFLVDVYGPYAASATAANTFLRSLLACGLPMVVRPMFFAMGVGPAMSVIGAVAAAALPVPFLFMKYGKALRRKSRFAPMPKDD